MKNCPLSKNGCMKIMKKICTKCRTMRCLDEFGNEKSKKDGLRSNCKKCQAKYKLENRKEINLKQSKMKRVSPWYVVFNSVRQRCNNKNSIGYKYYGGRGIRNELTLEDVQLLFLKDGGFGMLKPNIHRIDSNKNYSLKNCRFIEALEHTIHHSKPRREEKQTA